MPVDPSLRPNDHRLTCEPPRPCDGAMADMRHAVAGNAADVVLLRAQVAALSGAVSILRAANAEQAACIAAFRALTFSNPPTPTPAVAAPVDPIHRALGGPAVQAIGLLTR